jgi:hypothetical protein
MKSLPISVHTEVLVGVVPISGVRSRSRGNPDRKPTIFTFIYTKQAQNLGMRGSEASTLASITSSHACDYRCFLTIASNPALVLSII